VTSAGFNGRAILIVEEEPLIALDLQMAFESAGAKVVWSRVRDAVQVVEPRRFSAAILDLPHGSSEHRPIVRRLRAQGVPFIFYSTRYPDDVTMRGVPIVFKPEHPDRIVAAVELVLRS
jgi:DNA-binding response OmpR family regulator